MANTNEVHAVPGLSPDDPFESALIAIVETNRRKRKDYALDGDVFSNFRLSSEVLGLDGFDATESALFNVIQKICRLNSLRANNRLDDVANESVIDTYLDLAVYAIITYALALDMRTDMRAEPSTPKIIRGDGFERYQGVNIQHWHNRSGG